MLKHVKKFSNHALIREDALHYLLILGMNFQFVLISFKHKVINFNKTPSLENKVNLFKNNKLKQILVKDVNYLQQNNFNI